MLALAAGDARGHGWRLGEREKAEVPGVPERVHKSTGRKQKQQSRRKRKKESKI